MDTEPVKKRGRPKVYTDEERRKRHREIDKIYRKRITENSKKNTYNTELVYMLLTKLIELDPQIEIDILHDDIVQIKNKLNV